jgi:hypothetical protein
MLVFQHRIFRFDISQCLGIAAAVPAAALIASMLVAHVEEPVCCMTAFMLLCAAHLVKHSLVVCTMLRLEHQQYDSWQSWSTTHWSTNV